MSRRLETLSMVSSKSTLLFGTRLRKLREERGWSIPELLERAGKPCSKSALSQIETNQIKRPDIKIVEGVAEALGWSIDEARTLAGYPESGESAAVDTDLEFVLHGYEELSDPGKQMARDLIRNVILKIGEFEGKSITQKYKLPNEQKGEFWNPKDEEMPGGVSDVAGVIAEQKKKKRK